MNDLYLTTPTTELTYIHIQYDTHIHAHLLTATSRQPYYQLYKTYIRHAMLRPTQPITPTYPLDGLPHGPAPLCFFLSFVPATSKL